MNSIRNGAVDEPFNFAMDLNRNYNARSLKQLDSVMQYDDHVSSAVDVLKNRIRNSDRATFVTYRTIHPTLDMHAVYSRRKRQSFIDEYHRLSFSRFRLSSHNLKIETGRWSIQPRECVCVCMCACVCECVCVWTGSGWNACYSILPIDRKTSIFFSTSTNSCNFSWNNDWVECLAPNYCLKQYWLMVN